MVFIKRTTWIVAKSRPCVYSERARFTLVGGHIQTMQSRLYASNSRIGPKTPKLQQKTSYPILPCEIGYVRRIGGAPETSRPVSHYLSIQTSDLPEPAAAIGQAERALSALRAKFLNLQIHIHKAAQSSHFRGVSTILRTRSTRVTRPSRGTW